MLLCWELFSQIHKDSGKTLLTRGIIEKGHEILMKNLIGNPGRMSESKRQTVCPISNKNIYYPSPEFIKERFDTFLDYANQMYSYLDSEIRIRGVTEKLVEVSIKFYAWFFISFVRLHPFSDGNGRLTRMLHAYLQLSISPVPVGIYNMFSKTSKNDYMKVVVEVRGQHEKHACNEHWCFISEPRALSAVILDCVRCTWFDVVNIKRG
jgi:Fic family protein